jgi:hypothetical protein
MGPQPKGLDMKLTAKQIKVAERVIRKHYGIKEPLTDEEVQAEIDSLQRKRSSLGLSDGPLRLCSSLEVALQIQIPRLS